MTKLSEYLRLADERKLPDHRKAFIEPFISCWKTEKPPCCAIGGAAVVSGDFKFEVNEDMTVLTSYSRSTATKVGSAEDWDIYKFKWNKGDYRQRLKICPVCYYPQAQNLLDIIIHLYDYHEWSRTEIANWLDNDPLMQKIQKCIEQILKGEDSSTTLYSIIEK